MSPKQVRKTKRSYTKDDLNPEKHAYKQQRGMPSRQEIAEAMQRFKSNPESLEQRVERVVNALLEEVEYGAQMKADGKEVPFA